MVDRFVRGVEQRLGPEASRSPRESRANPAQRAPALAVAAAIALAGGAGSAAWAAPSWFAGPEPDPVPQSVRSRPEGLEEGRQLLAERKWAEATIVLKGELRREPGSATVALDLSRALAFSGRREEALNALGGALERQKAVAVRAELTGRIRVVSRIFFSQTTFQTYQDGLNLLLARKYRLARERLEKSLEAEPDNVEILVRIGQSLELDGDHDSAAERLRLARRLDPFEPEISLWLGKALHERGELGPALEELRRADAELPGSEAAPVWLSELLAVSGQKVRAVQLLEADQRANPLHVEALVALARLRMELAGRDASGLWSARKDLQTALSRVAHYGASARPSFESELGVDLRPAVEELRADIAKDLDHVDTRLRPEAE